MLGKEHLQKAVAVESRDNFYCRGITLKAQFCYSISPNSSLVEIRSNENFLALLEFYSPSCFSSILIEELNRVGEINNCLGGIYTDLFDLCIHFIHT